MGQSRGTGAEQMKIKLFVLYFVVAVMLLMLTFRVDGYLQNSTLGKVSTIASYIILAVLLTLVASFLSPLVTHLLFSRLRERGGTMDTAATAGITFLLFCLISILFGPL